MLRTNAALGGGAASLARSAAILTARLLLKIPPILRPRPLALSPLFGGSAVRHSVSPGLSQLSSCLFASKRQNARREGEKEGSISRGQIWRLGGRNVWSAGLKNLMAPLFLRIWKWERSRMMMEEKERVQYMTSLPGNAFPFKTVSWAKLNLN